MTACVVAASSSSSAPHTPCATTTTGPHAPAHALRPTLTLRPTLAHQPPLAHPPHSRPHQALTALPDPLPCHALSDRAWPIFRGPKPLRTMLTARHHEPHRQHATPHPPRGLPQYTLWSSGLRGCPGGNLRRGDGHAAPPHAQQLRSHGSDDAVARRGGMRVRCAARRLQQRRTPQATPQARPLLRGRPH